MECVRTDSSAFFASYTALFRAGVLGHGLGAFRHGVLGQFTRKQKTDSSLNFAGGDGRALVVVSQSRRFGSNSFEDVIDERVHDGHSLAANPGVRMDLLQDFEDIAGISLLSLLPLLFVPNTRRGLLSGLLGSFGRHFRRHDDV